MGILYKARPYFDKRALLCIYNAFIHSYLNFAKTAWCSTDRSKFKINKNTLLEFSFTKTNLQIHQNISEKIIY